MKAETKLKIKTGWYRFKQEVKELAPWIGLGAVSGMIIGGYGGAIANGREINRIKKRLKYHEEVIDHNADIVTHNARESTKDHEKLEELERRQALLMEQALRETTGSVK